MKNFVTRQVVTSLIYLALAPIPALAQSISSWGFAIGPSVPQQRMSVQNFTNYYCALVADGKVITTKSGALYSPPGATLYDLRKSQTNYQQIPVLALYFSDSQGKNYVGVAETVFGNLTPEWGTTNHWVVTNNNIDAWGGGQLIGKPSPSSSLLQFVEEKVRFPKEAWDGLVVTQFFNNSHYQVRIQANGITQAVLQPMKWYPLRIRGAYDWFSITLTALDNGRVVGFRTGEAIYAQIENIYARNVILDDASFHPLP